ncbi:MAG: hypothetical protein P9E24_07495 [Candidatus Competibacter sp.]|nr:hypothetical protein [Candidatus Competibacter sp.]MDG4584739.1 hypothetical protein [Candidatus Competibacter sp.]
MFLIGWGRWTYLGFHWVISLCVDLVGGGFGLGIFGFLVALRELEKIEEQNGFGLESIAREDEVLCPYST